MTNYLKGWQCIGCGRIDAPATCIGVCQDRKVEVLTAFEHEAALAAERQRAHVLEEVVRRLAFTSPRDGEWERSWKALQALARRTLAERSS